MVSLKKTVAFSPKYGLLTRSMDENPEILAAAVKTHLLGGRVTLMQPTKGYRIGMDGALLAAMAATYADKHRLKTVLELGCGVGGVLLSLNARAPHLSLLGLERDAAAMQLCESNIALNEAQNVEVLGFDIADGFVALDRPRFDLVISNPPYYDDPTAMRPVHQSRAGAWMADDGLGAWLSFAKSAVRDGGGIIFIHRADRLGDILSGLNDKCGSFEIWPIQPFAEKPAKRVIVATKRMGKAPLVLRPALILHDHGQRKHTPEIEGILRGEGIVF